VPGSQASEDAAAAAISDLGYDAQVRARCCLSSYSGMPLRCALTI